MTIILKQIILLIITVIIAVYFKSLKPEYSLYIVLSATIIGTFIVVNSLSDIISSMQLLLNNRINNILGISNLFKMVIISYVCDISSSICKDQGYASLSCIIVLMGKLLIIGMSIDIICYFAGQYL